MSRKIILLVAAICCHYVFSFAGGFIITNQVVLNTDLLKVQERTLFCKKLRVDVQLNGPLATTTVEQTFQNTTDMRMEGDYFFPLPKNSVIKEFRMEMNGVMVRAEMLDATNARKIYEDIVRQMKDPALLEFTDQGMLRMRIFPIEPNSTKEIKLVFSHYMPVEDGTYEYSYPLNALRYNSKPIEDVVVNAEFIALRDEFGHQRLREQKYTPGQIDTQWTEEIKKDFLKWIDENPAKVPMTKDELNKLLKDRHW